MDRKQIPKSGFLDTCEYLGYINGERRWRIRRTTLICTWDALHGEIEVFDRLGHHVGVLDAVDSKEIKPARKERRIRV